MKSYLLSFIIFIYCSANAQIGEVIWEENFNNLDNWLIETGNGSWAGAMANYNFTAKIMFKLLRFLTNLAIMGSI